MRQAEDHEAGIEAATRVFEHNAGRQPPVYEVLSTRERMKRAIEQGYLSRCPSPERDTVRRIVEWLRGPAAEEARAWAIDHDVPPEDELAGQIERAFLAEFSADDTNEGR